MAAPSTTSTPAATPIIKRSHSEMGSDDEPLGAVPFSSRRFASKIIDIYVGDERYHYAAHKAFLFQSEDLKNQYDAANRAKKKTNKGPTVLNLPRETPNEFGQLLEYLYLGHLTLHASEPQGQANELLSIWTMGSKHSLLDMQNHVIRKLEELDIAGKLPTLEFLRLADRLYEAEVDNGLRRYFAKVATDVVRKIKPSDMPVLLEMITEGGSFASDLFHAHHQAFGLRPSGSATEQLKTTSAFKEEDHRHQHAAKRARMSNLSASASSTPGSPDVRTQWDKEHHIPEAWETASTEDKLLVTKTEGGVSWNEIAEAWEKATGGRMSINDLIHRYNRIEANVLRLGKRDSDLLMAAKSAIEGKFNNEKWPLIAAHIVEHGGNKYEPIRLKRYCDALDAVNNKVKTIEEEVQNGALIVRGTGPHKYAHDGLELPTEVVGGVRVENSKPIDVRRRRRTVKAPTAREARRRPTAGGKNKSAAVNNNADVSSDEDTEMASREASTLFVGADEEEEGPRDTGVRVRNEGKEKQGRVPGNMRFDRDGDVGLERGVNVIEDAGSSIVEEVGEEVVEEDEVVDYAEDIGEEVG
ncbi:MAG: hypothetical protein Q9225_005463 [Loekoesia sp. 1 TL-2023]